MFNELVISFSSSDCLILITNQFPHSILSNKKMI